MEFLRITGQKKAVTNSVTIEDETQTLTNNGVDYS
jgi:hypothetical protein